MRVKMQFTNYHLLDTPYLYRGPDHIATAIAIAIAIVIACCPLAKELPFLRNFTSTIRQHDMLTRLRPLAGLQGRTTSVCMQHVP